MVRSSSVVLFFKWIMPDDVRTSSSTGSPLRLADSYIAVMIATLAEGIAEYNLGDTEVLTMFLVVVGCGYLALEKEVVSQP